MRAVVVCAAICVTAFLMSFGPAPARAQDAPAPAAAKPATPAPKSASAAHDHHGFYLRWTTGIGNASAKADVANGPGQPSTSVKVSGLSGEGDVAIGTVPFQSLPIALHVTAWGWRTNDPTVEDPDKSDLDGVLSAGAVGLGATWFLPSNSYVSVAGGVGKLSLKLPHDKTKYETKSGTAVDAVLGKEWWVSPSWGIGLAGGLNYFSAKDPKQNGLSSVSGTKWSGTSYSLRLSATYN